MPIINMYGMTETTSATTHHRWKKISMQRAGFALPGVQLIIKDPDQNGEGEICMKGRNTMMGYYKNQEACESTFDENGFVMSGDRGKLDSEGFLQITGRIKELIITAGGENIAPVPIEDTFKDNCFPCANIMVIGDM
jgi:long-chain-fatty-acid--CoA ligase ACSBG